ncbi:sigma-70 family RNA polymerase sigma factor [Agromyces sp. Marseille-P2726]|uniref:sigma-70 family RNA polymerase sigma factor n=1 Tax=Agromyces sp. Marseille-P2726 TaxID=2709132 RepID=UPI00156FDF97|nr:sigma-70 family RNA polymerase sigma factor [Agromyces sp. Marseille-P2726]
MAGLSGRSRRTLEEAIVLRHLDVVDGVVRRLASGYREQEDLRQVGRIGLVQAVRRFDLARGDSFIAFAMPTIAGEIKRYLRDCGWFVRPPRPVQELAAEAQSAGEELVQRLGRQPSTREIAEQLNRPRALVAEAVVAHENLRPVSLDVAGDDDEAWVSSFGRQDPRLERADLRLSLRQALARLRPRERRIVFLRFVEERTQREIAADIGVTQMQVSRLLAGILERLRRELEEPAAGAQPDPMHPTRSIAA